MKKSIELVDKLENVCSDAMGFICDTANNAMTNDGDLLQALENIAGYAQFCRDDIFHGFKQFYR